MLSYEQKLSDASKHAHKDTHPHKKDTEPHNNTHSIHTHTHKKEKPTPTPHTHTHTHTHTHSTHKHTHTSTERQRRTENRLFRREEEGGTRFRTLAPTLFLQPDDLRVGAEAVPRRAVVDGLEVGGHDVAHGERGDHPFLRADRLHRVAARRARLQHRLLPGPGLRGAGHQHQPGSTRTQCATVSH